MNTLHCFSKGKKKKEKKKGWGELTPPSSPGHNNSSQIPDITRVWAGREELHLGYKLQLYHWHNLTLLLAVAMNNVKPARRTEHLTKKNNFFKVYFFPKEVPVYLSFNNSTCSNFWKRLLETNTDSRIIEFLKIQSLHSHCKII